MDDKQRHFETENRNLQSLLENKKKQIDQLSVQSTDLMKQLQGVNDKLNIKT